MDTTHSYQNIIPLSPRLMASRHSRPEVPAGETESIKYAGSKRKLLPYILKLVARTGAASVLDGFSGSTRVAQAMARHGLLVVANDLAVWSEHLARCYLQNPRPASDYGDLISHLNAVPPKDGWFTQHYGGLPDNGLAVQADGMKRPWQIHNTRKLDAIRDEVDELSLSPLEQSVALTSLMLALDRVDNTLGHFVSYLKRWSTRSYADLRLQVPAILPPLQPHRVHCGDVFDVADAQVDVAYYDPPYGSNNDKMPPSRVRYASYYHLWTTVCLNDRPELFGKAQRRTDTSDRIATSEFEEFRRADSGRFKAVESIERLIRSTAAEWIILSYNSAGRATADELMEVLSNNGTVAEIVQVDYKRNVMASMKWTNDWTRDVVLPNHEFLFLLHRKSN